MEACEDASAAASAADWPAISCGDIATLFALGLALRRAPAVPRLPVAVWVGLASLLSVVFCLRCSTTVGGRALFVVGAGLAPLDGLAGFEVVFGGAGGGAIVVEVVVEDGPVAGSGVPAAGAEVVAGVDVVAGVEVVPSFEAGVLAACAPLIGPVSPAAVSPPPARAESIARHAQ